MQLKVHLCKSSLVLVDISINVKWNGKRSKVNAHPKYHIKSPTFTHSNTQNTQSIQNLTKVYTRRKEATTNEMI